MKLFSFLFTLIVLLFYIHCFSDFRYNNESAKLMV